LRTPPQAESASQPRLRGTGFVGSSHEPTQFGRNSDDPNREKLLSLIENETGVDPRTLAPDSRLAELADSLGCVNLICALEDSFGMKISTEQGLRLRTLQDLMALIAEPRLATA
jgi:acyl carrier protein